MSQQAQLRICSCELINCPECGGHQCLFRWRDQFGTNHDRCEVCRNLRKMRTAVHDELVTLLSEDIDDYESCVELIGIFLEERFELNAETADTLAEKLVDDVWVDAVSEGQEQQLEMMEYACESAEAWLGRY